MPRPQRFSVVLVVNSELANPPQDNIPAPARKALEDMKGFLPFKSYRLFGSGMITVPGPGAIATTRVSGGDNETFMAAVGLWALPFTATPRASATPVHELKLDFILRGPDDTGQQPPRNVRSLAVPVTMNIGETVVVGTSRIGGARAVRVLLTAERELATPDR